MKQLNHKNIILGITGGIAAYKSADLVRRLREVGAEVRVVMTEAAKAFITPLTLQALSGQPVHEDLLDQAAEAAMGHIELARWADLVLVAPASADFLARLAHGHGNDLLTTLCLATSAPIAVAPAMNQQMWQDKATQANITTLQAQDVAIFGPAEGEQACGEVGPGRMLEPLELVAKAAHLFKNARLAGLKVLLTAGPTREHLDPIRYMTNHSSGKMGYAIAAAAVEAGADVTLISGPVELTCPEAVTCIEVETALEMYAAVMAELDAHPIDLFIATAAVADYRFADIAEHKRPSHEEHLHLELVSNPDILAAVAARPDKPFTVGLAAQTKDVVTMAAAKLKKKNIDMIAANQVGQADRGFHADDNAFCVLWADGQVELDLRPKTRLARDLIALIAERRQ